MLRLSQFGNNELSSTICYSSMLDDMHNDKAQQRNASFLANARFYSPSNFMPRAKYEKTFHKQ